MRHDFAKRRTRRRLMRPFWWYRAERVAPRAFERHTYAGSAARHYRRRGTSAPPKLAFARHNTGRIARHFRQRGLNAQPKVVLRTAIIPGALQGTVGIAVQAHRRNRPCACHNTGRIARHCRHRDSSAPPNAAIRAHRTSLAMYLVLQRHARASCANLPCEPHKSRAPCTASAIIKSRTHRRNRPCAPP